MKRALVTVRKVTKGKVVGQLRRERALFYGAQGSRGPKDPKDLRGPKGFLLKEAEKLAHDEERYPKTG